jgi:hypothetical protein
MGYMPSIICRVPCEALQNNTQLKGKQSYRNTTVPLLFAFIKYYNIPGANLNKICTMLHLLCLHKNCKHLVHLNSITIMGSAMILSAGREASFLTQISFQKSSAGR